MGRRSDFKRIERDFYETPAKAVVSLLPHLPHGARFAEPCAGEGALIKNLLDARPDLSCWFASDIFDGMDALDVDLRPFDLIYITNPPWTRSILHPLIEHLSDQHPTWLLFDAAWIHTLQSIPYLPRLRKIVSIGRVRFIPGTKYDGKDDCAWYLFDKPSDQSPTFHGRTKK